MKTKQKNSKSIRNILLPLLFLFAIAVAASCGGGGGGGGGGDNPGGGGGTGVLTSIAVTPRDAAVLLDGLRQFTATGTYSDSSTQDITNQVTWSSSNTSVATVSTGGSVTGISVGTTTITAALISVSGNTTLTVSATALPRTGQTKCYNYSGVEITPCTGTGQDGELQTGAVWPDPRFTNLDGSVPLSGDVVVDRFTGLIWTKDANKPSPAACYPGITGSQQQALNYIACLNTYQYLGYSDWRLPNINELESLATAGVQDTAGYLAAQGFTNVQTAMPYWSSTTSAGRTDYAWCIPFSSSQNGNIVTGSKSSSYSIWPVRGGW